MKTYKKILWSGDPHGKVDTIDVFKEYLALLEKTVYEQQADVVVIAGDLFHNHAIIRSEVLNAWLDYFNKSRIDHILLKGNHDETVAGSGVHALNAFRKYANIVVVDKPFVISGMPEMNRLAFIPYTHKQEEFMDALNMLAGDYTKKTILFIHQTLVGAKYDNGYYAPDGFDASGVADYLKVISGHIHTYQEFGNVIYPGTPFAHGFVDTNQSKGLWVVDAATAELTLVPLDLPRYFTVELSTAGFFDYFSSKDKKEFGRHYFRVLLKDSKAAIRALQDSSEFKKLKKDFRITIKAEYNDSVVTDIKITESLTPEKMMEKYISDIMKTGLDKVKLTDMSLNLMRGNK